MDGDTYHPEARERALCWAEQHILFPDEWKTSSGWPRAAVLERVRCSCPQRATGHVLEGQIHAPCGPPN